MKVKTNLKSGNVVSDTYQEMTKAVNQANDFVSEASNAAEKITSGLSNTWNCVTKSF